MIRNNFIHSEISESIIQCYYKVYNTLGFGFLEKVYENALEIEFKKMDFKYQKQHPIDVLYTNITVGKYYADFIVENRVIVELKASETIHKDHEAQIINYLRATNINVGLLLNFGRKPEFKRKVFHRNFKTKNHIKS